MATTNVAEHHDGVQYAPNPSDPKNAASVDNEKIIEQHEHILGPGEKSLVYADDDQEPELHVRTWIAVAAMVVLNFVILVALQGPPTGLAYIAADLKGAVSETWVPNSALVFQAVLSPILSSVSDLFQARKTLLVLGPVVAFVGAAIAPGSSSINRVIAAQCLIGVGFAVISLNFTVPSEILPKRWRPMAQAAINSGAALGSIAGPLIIGALTKHDPANGWRTFYWIEAGLWAGAAILIFIGYRPPKRYGRLHHLSFWQKLRHIDFVGAGLLAAGVTMLLTGLNLGGNLYSWKNSHTLATLIVGGLILIAFGVYEWKGTETGILNHDLFRTEKAMWTTFVICLALIFIEGILVFSYIVFYPILTEALFETDPVLISARIIVSWVATLFGTVAFGYLSVKMRSIQYSLFFGFLLNTAGTIGLSTIQPGQNLNPLFLSALVGFGIGAPLSQCITGVQLSTPHSLIATATAATVTSRAIGSTLFTSIYSATLQNKLSAKLPAYIAKAAATAGLPPSSIPAFVGALASNNTKALPGIAGITPAIIAAGIAALKQAYADSVRVVFIIAAPFGALACILCFFLGDLKKLMNYHVDAPIEDLHAKPLRPKVTEAA